MTCSKIRSNPDCFLLSFASSVLAGCGLLGSPQQPSCAPGQGLSAGECVPTPTIVFRQCVEAFRAESVEEGKTKGVKVGGGASRFGHASLSRSEAQSIRTEFAGMNPDDTRAALSECRRQEEAEREGRFARAVTEIGRLEQAKAELAKVLRVVESELESAQQTRAQTESERDELAAALQSRAEELEAAKEILVIDRPCRVEAWPECAVAATLDHEAGDYASAHVRYAAACAHDQPDACGNWGLMFEHGLGVPVDPGRAEQLYASGCEGGASNGCVSLASLLWAGGRSPKRVQSLLGAACDEDVGRACTLLGRWRESEGEGDLAKVADLYEKACALDDAEGCLVTGLHALDTADGRPDVERARRALGRACELGNGEACAAATRVTTVFTTPANPRAPT